MYRRYQCYYEFARERKFIRHCINQNPPPNPRLKAEIKSTPLILQTAKESRKAFTYRLCDLLVYLNLYVWRICSYYEFASERKFIRHCINHGELLTPRMHFASTEG